MATVQDTILVTLDEEEIFSEAHEEFINSVRAQNMWKVCILFLCACSQVFLLIYVTKRIKYGSFRTVKTGRFFTKN